MTNPLNLGPGRARDRMKASLGAVHCLLDSNKEVLNADDAEVRTSRVCHVLLAASMLQVEFLTDEEEHQLPSPTLKAASDAAIRVFGLKFVKGIHKFGPATVCRLGRLAHLIALKSLDGSIDVDYVQFLMSNRPISSVQYCVDCVSDRLC